MEKQVIQCSNCSRLPQPREEFLNSRNKICKLCKKCREKSNKRSAKPEVKEYIKEWLSSQDQEKIRKQRLEAAHKWIKDQKKKDEKSYNLNIQTLRKKCATTKVNVMKRSAATRNILWNIEDDFAIKLIKSPCIYCGYIDLEKQVNGIDRLDSHGHYTPENSVSCCTHCNIMKACYDPITFVNRCKRIGECLYVFPEIPVNDIPKNKKRPNNQSDPKGALVGETPQCLEFQIPDPEN